MKHEIIIHVRDDEKEHVELWHLDGVEGCYHIPLYDAANILHAAADELMKRASAGSN